MRKYFDQMNLWIDDEEFRKKFQGYFIWQIISNLYLKHLLQSFKLLKVQLFSFMNKLGSISKPIHLTK